MSKDILVYRNCFTGDISGGDMHMSGLCRWLLEQKQGISLHLIHPENDGQEAAYPETRQVQRLTYTDPLAGRNPALMYWARALLGTVRVRLPKTDAKRRLLIASSHFLPDVLPVTLKGGTQALRAAYIYHVIQDMPRPSGLNNTLANLQERFCFYLIKKRFDYVITDNQSVTDRLRELGFTKQRILSSTNFVARSTETILPYEKRDITLAFCGRMVKQKGIYDFLDICKSAQQHIPDFKAVMIGQGPELARVRKKIAAEKLNIETTGFADDDTKFDRLSRSKLFVFPSVEEGWGIAVAEALTTGTPVIAYDLPVYGPIFGKNIDTVPIAKPAQLKERTLSTLAAYQEDPSSYLKKQQTIRQAAQDFSRDKVCQQEYNFLMSVQEAL